MANLPQSLSINAPFGDGPSQSKPAAPPGAGVVPPGVGKDRKMASAEHLVLDLSNPDLRKNALLELSKNKELFQDLASFVWNSFVTIAALIQLIYLCTSILSSILPASQGPLSTCGLPAWVSLVPWSRLMTQK